MLYRPVMQIHKKKRPVMERFLYISDKINYFFFPFAGPPFAAFAASWAAFIAAREIRT